MRTPTVTEMPRRLEPVAHDPFIDGFRAVVEQPSRPADPALDLRPRAD